MILDIVTDKNNIPPNNLLFPPNVFYILADVHSISTAHFQLDNFIFQQSHPNISFSATKKKNNRPIFSIDCSFLNLFSCYSTGVTLIARNLPVFSSRSASKLTFAPSFNVLKPSTLISEKCTKISSPPSSLVKKP